MRSSVVFPVIALQFDVHNVFDGISGGVVALNTVALTQSLARAAHIV